MRSLASKHLEFVVLATSKCCSQIVRSAGVSAALNVRAAAALNVRAADDWGEDLGM
jgi:hypothetical protein